MTTDKNTKQHATIATLLLFIIGMFVSSNSFAWDIGDKVGGGIVFYVYSVDGVRHGLIAAQEDQNQGEPIRWISGSSYPYMRANASGVGAGKANTVIIISRAPGEPFDQNPFAASVCNNYSVTDADGVMYGDFYLPSIFELNLLFKQKNVVGGFTDTDYWSSTDFVDGDGVFVLNFFNGNEGVTYKGRLLGMRCIRAF